MPDDSDESEESKRATVTIRINQERRDDWTDHAEEYAKYENRTDFIKKAVEQRISEDEGRYNVYSDVMDILEAIQDIDQGKLSDIKQTVDAIEQTQSTSEELNEAVQSLQDTIEQESGSDQMQF